MILYSMIRNAFSKYITKGPFCDPVIVLQMTYFSKYTKQEFKTLLGINNIRTAVSICWWRPGTKTCIIQTFLQRFITHNHLNLYCTQNKLISSFVINYDVIKLVSYVSVLNPPILITPSFTYPATLIIPIFLSLRIVYELNILNNYGFWLLV